MNSSRARAKTVAVNAAALVLLAACATATETAARSAGPGNGDRVYSVSRVIDGDTIEVLLPDGTSVAQVRLIGLDAPEYRPPREDGTADARTECGGAQATGFLTDRLPEGDAVRLVQDETQGDTDRYGRLLRYVQDQASPRTQDGEPQWEDLGLLSIRGGLSKEYTYDEPYAQLPAYLDAQGAARADGAGSWTMCGPDF